MKHRPAGWYRNENDRRQHDYWDGFAWADPNPIGATPVDAEPAVPAEGLEERGDSGDLGTVEG